MEKDIKVSIVIPVYKVEKYLNQCVESVLKQTYQNIEIILVDDGSPDRCPKLCDEYAYKDSRVKVVHKQNGGLSSARNAGIDVATGDYIIFIDSDDFWSESDAVESVVKRINETEADVVCFGYKEYLDDLKKFGSKGLRMDQYMDLKLKGEDLIARMVSDGSYVSSAWCKAIRKELIKNNILYFVEGITSEDIDWSARVLIKANKIDVVPRNFYVYRQRKDSIVHTIKYENLKMLADNIKRCVGLGGDIISERRKKIYYSYVAYQYLTFFRVAMVCSDDGRTKSLIKEMKSISWLFKYRMNKRVKKVGMIYNMLGYRFMYFALCLYFKCCRK